MMNGLMEKALQLAETVYQGETLAQAMQVLQRIAKEWLPKGKPCTRPLSSRDVMLIAYGDSLVSPQDKALHVLDTFVQQYCQGAISNIHLLPIFPYTSDDGFSVADYAQVDENLGGWNDVEEMAEHFGVMLDAVVNHTSQAHPWFQKCLAGQAPYTEYYLECDPAKDYTRVVRPRALPLLTSFVTKGGKKWYWTTFSEDQVDLNYGCPLVLGEVLEILLHYAARGARFIRLDAVGFIWKQLGTSCMHLPQAHAIVKLMRLFMDAVFPGTILITETNVPHMENISYFGGGDEAQLVYQFPLPVLGLHTMLTQNSEKLTAWAQSLAETPLPAGCTYFNFLASHDGVGMRPAEGLLSVSEQKHLVDTVLQNGGRVSYRQNSDGSQTPYELNISYIDALTEKDEMDDETLCARFLAVQAIMLSLQGMPGIYYHSLLGSRSWQAGVQESGINRRINREKLQVNLLREQLQASDSLRQRVFSAYCRLLQTRAGCKAFSPMVPQEVKTYGPEFFVVLRRCEESGQAVLAVVNVTNTQRLFPCALQGVDLLEKTTGESARLFAPYQVRWMATGGVQ